MKTKPLFLTALLASSLPGAALEPTALTPEPQHASTRIAAGPELPVPMEISVPLAAAPQMPAGTRLEKVQFESCPLSEIIAYLETKEQEAEKGRSLNVILSPGLENRVLPSLSLRNVTTTEVLSIVASLLDLKLEPVKGDDPKMVVAWMVKSASQTAEAIGGDMGSGGGGLQALPRPIPDVRRTDPGARPDLGGTSGTASGGSEGGGGGGDFQAVADPNVPRIAVVASGSGMPGMDGGSGGAAPLKQSKVFGIAALLPPPGDSDEAKKLRAIRLEELLSVLQRFATEQDNEAEVRCYPALNIIMVKSTALPLISEAVEAMKSNAASVQAASQSVDPWARKLPATLAPGETEHNQRRKLEEAGHDKAAPAKGKENPADH